MHTRELSNPEQFNPYRSHDSLVENYKNGGSSKGLIELYTPFINSYLYLFRYGVLKSENKSIKTFISRFTSTSKKEKNKLIKKKVESMSPEERHILAIKAIKKMYRMLGEQDIYNYLVITLLTQAKRYEKRDRNFTAYLMKSFPHELYRHIKHLHVEIALNAISYADYNGEIVEAETTSMEQQEQFLLDLDADHELMHPDWLAGKTANEPFRSMKREDRYILAKYYEPRGIRLMGVSKKLVSLVSDREIGILTGRNRKSIQRSRKRLTDRLNNELEKGEEQWVRERNY